MYMCLRRCVYAHGCIYQGTHQPQVQTVALTQASLGVEYVEEYKEERWSENSQNVNIFCIELDFIII